MSTLWDITNMSIDEKRRWEIAHSSLARSRNVTYEECRTYACQSITDNLTKISIGKGEIIEIPYGVPFNFIGRVDTSWSENNPKQYYQTYMNRSFVSYSAICNKNVSHYKGNVFFVYNIYPEDISHIFPMDSDTKRDADKEETLTPLPSLWLSLSDLNDLSIQLGVYNQVTIKTRRNEQIYKPFAVVAIEQTSDKIQKIADSFEIGTIILHPDKNAIHYDRDLLYDYYKLQEVSTVMEKTHGFPVISMYYPD